MNDTVYPWRECKEVAGARELQIHHWREKATAQSQVKDEIVKHLFVRLPPSAYDADEINMKADAVFAHIYTAGLGESESVSMKAGNAVSSPCEPATSVS